MFSMFFNEINSSSFLRSLSFTSLGNVSSISILSKFLKSNTISFLTRFSLVLLYNINLFKSKDSIKLDKTYSIFKLI